MNQSIIHSDYPLTHPGVERAEKVVSSFQSIGQSISASRTIAVMLLAAVAAAFIVVADQMIDTWADGHLLAAWVALWLVGFSALAVFAGAARKLAVTFTELLSAWLEQARRANADRQLWAIAQSDSRVMADLSAAMARAER